MGAAGLAMGGAGAVLALLGGLWLASADTARVPALELQRPEGGTLELEALVGRPMLVNFWATTCSGCMKEMPHLVDLHEALAGEGLVLVGIAMPYDPPHRVRALVRARDIPYAIALDLEGEAAEAFGGVRNTPTTFLVAPDGTIVQRTTGALDYERLRRRIRRMLEDGAGGVG